MLHAYVNLSELILIHKELTSQTSTALIDEILEKDLSYWTQLSLSDLIPNQEALTITPLFTFFGSIDEKNV